MKVKCPSCNRGLKVNEEMAGSKRVCPYCKGTVVIPAADESGDAGGGIRIETGGSKSAPPGPEIKTSVGTGRKPSAARADASAGAKTDASNVSLLVSGLLGLGCAIAFYLLLLPFHLLEFGVATKFWDLASIGINFPTTLLMFWCFAILFLKWRKLQQQRTAMMMDLLPTEISKEITIESLDEFVRHIRSLPNVGGSNILINRVLRGIEHFRVRKSAAETVTMMESQSMIDASNVAGSYTVVKVFIWAMPILGFIGTVMGVSTAVSGLSSTLSNSGDMGALMESMQGVFGGLGTAFDTTLLALIMSLIVKIPQSVLQKSEDDLVTLVDEYCNENLLRRLNDGREGGAERGASASSANREDTKAIRDAVQAAMETHHAELKKWLGNLDSVGGKMTELNTQFEGVQRGLMNLSRVLEKLGEQQVVVQQVEAPKKRGWFR